MRRSVSSVAFVAPPGLSWTLPLYELALLSAAHLTKQGRTGRIVLAIPVIDANDPTEIEMVRQNVSNPPVRERILAGIGKIPKGNWTSHTFNEVWVGGRWVWRDRWVWAPGFWSPRPWNHAVWVEGHWVHRHHEWIWVNGHWR